VSGIVRETSGDDGHVVSDQESTIETDSELSDAGDIGSGLESFHEGLGAGLGDSS